MNAELLAQRAEPVLAQSVADLKAAGRDNVDWIWQGYLGAGNVTLLTSLWKSGKSTLISVLLSRLKGGGMLAGLPVRAGRALVISEESASMWVQRCQRVDLDGHVDWFCQPFRGKPTEQAWLDLLDRVVRLHEQKGVALVVIDSLANLSSMRTENDAVQMVTALAPLQELSMRGLATLITHHPKKGRTVPGQAARGSGALSAYVDIIMEMQMLSRKPADRRRKLRAYSRHPATTPLLVMEWSADGTDYASLGTSLELDFERGWLILQDMLAHAEECLTRRAILRCWPVSAPTPSKLTLWRWLDRAVKDHQVLRDGKGTRKDPYTYKLPGMQEKWNQKDLENFERVLGMRDPLPPPPPPLPSEPET